MTKSRIAIAIFAMLLIGGPVNAQARNAGSLKLGTASSPTTTATGAIKGGGGPVKDTCTESTPDNPEACDIDELTARCDAAGGGMSTLDGGGVDCDLRE